MNDRFRDRTVEELPERLSDVEDLLKVAAEELADYQLREPRAWLPVARAAGKSRSIRRQLGSLSWPV